MRNMTVHREHRNEVITFKRTKQHGHVFYRLPPRDPSESNMAGMRSAKDEFRSYYLQEDLADLITDIQRSLNATVVGTLEVLRSTWEWRKSNRHVSVSPEAQWKLIDGNPHFAGYGKTIDQSVYDNAVMVLNPLDVQRLKSAGVGDFH